MLSLLPKMPILAILNIVGKFCKSRQGCRQFTRSEDMGINIQHKTNYSFLFSNLGSSGGGAASNLNFLSDYASIKNGSYGKLMKAYYGKTDSKDIYKSNPLTNPSNATGKDTTKTLAKVQSSTDALKESADALLATGKNSVFNQKDAVVTDGEGNETTAKVYDTDKIYKEVSQFVKDYNSVLGAAGNVNSTTILGRTTSMITATKANTKMLNSLGITINKDNTLSVDEKTFKAADMSKAKSLFQGNGSYGYRVSAQASLINFAADKEAAKANTYGMNGAYNNTYSAGNIFNSFF